MRLPAALGVEIPVKKIAAMLTGLEFKVEVKGKTLVIQSPDHRMDIHDGVVGKSDILEEIARMYGYDNIPAARLADLMPPVHPQPAYEVENRIRELLTLLGMQEIITYRLTDPAREARLIPARDRTSAGRSIYRHQESADSRTQSPAPGIAVVCFGDC